MSKIGALLGALLTVALVGGSLVQAPQAQAFTSTSQLKSARVPSMCDNPSGRLVNGKLPGHYVYLDQKKSKLGQIRKGGGKEAVGVFECSQGGIGWPDHLVFYGSGGKIIGHYDTGFVKQKGTYAGRQTVQSVSISKKGVVTVNVIEVPLKGDNELWGSAGAKLTFAWDAKQGRVVRKSTKIYSDVKGTAKKLISLVKAGKTKQAKSYASAGVVKELSYYWKDIKKQNKTAYRKGSMKLGSCGGEYSGGAWSGAYGYYLFGQRGCVVTFVWPLMHKHDSQDYGLDSLLVFGHKSSDKKWKSWYATSFEMDID